MGAQRCEPAGMEFAARSGSGDRVTAILEGAEEVEARYVVMSTHGRSGFVRWRLGSVADKVVQGARRPTVLVLPQLDVVLGERIGRITVALDGSALAERGLAEGERIARQSGAGLLLVQAVTAIVPVTPLGFAASYEEANRAAVESVETYLASMAARLSDLEVTTSVRTADPRTAIVDAGAESDLIVLASHGRRDLPRLALGSVADAVVRSAGWPVMVVPAEEERGD